VVGADCYGLPDGPVGEFLERFRQHIREREMGRYISESEFAASLRLGWSSLRSRPPNQKTNDHGGSGSW